jgi:hypothetical protein
MDDFSSELMARLRERVADDGRRTSMSGAYHPGLDMVSLLRLLGGSPGSPLHGMMGQFGNLLETDRGYRPPPRPSPASEAEIAAAEAALGRPLPPALRRLYAEIADGEFGPGEGLFPLECIVEDYDELTSGPMGPQGQPWPANLLPIADGHFVDADSGAVIGWDPDEMLKGEKMAWDRAFKREAESLPAWLEQWLGEPSASERMKAGEIEGLRQIEAMEPLSEEDLQEVVELYRQMSPAERAAHSLPELGWEEVVRQRFGGP